MAGAIVPDLGNRLFVQIDPAWHWVSDAILLSPTGDTRLSAMFMDFDRGITESVGVRYSDIDVLGRAEPLKVWMGNGSREVSLVFQFRAQGGNVDFSALGGSQRGPLTNSNNDQAAAISASNDAKIQDALFNEVQAPARFLDWLRYPYIDVQGVSHGPPPVYLSIGRLLRLRSVITACSITWLSPFDTETMLPHGADVAVTFSSVTSRVGNYEAFDATRIQPSDFTTGLDDR